MARQELRVGFIGLGIMGEPMVRNVLKAGFPLTVFNRTSAKTERLRDEGAKVANSPAELGPDSDVIVSCVSDTPDVLEVILDPQHGVIAKVRDGTTVIDCSTAGPDAAKQCDQALREKGAAFLDAPISGGDVGARDGTLSIMVGGDRGHFDRAKPVLEAMGKTITYCGQCGAGYITKLCNQICGAINLLGVAEAISLATAAGIDTEAMVTAVSSGAAGSWMLTHLGPKMLTRDDSPGFFVDYQLKDLRIASDAAHSLGVPLPGLGLAEAMFRAASAGGHGRDGTQAIYHVLEKLRGG